MMISLTINGKRYSLECSPGETLLDVLRRLGFKSIKRGCDTGNCGACTVLIDNRPVATCIMLAVQANGSQITTLEGLTESGEIRHIQEAFLDNGAPQCGFCSPGILLVAKALLDSRPEPGRDDIRRAISGNICRCSGYVKIVDAIVDAAKRSKSDGSKN